ncbi:hypothetical protein FACS189487_07540 [Campylobacterota bacterium]|nr:hypothetical protein FACS189487_07540 [Campylobacterota bacterium]
MIMDESFRINFFPSEEETVVDSLWALAAMLARLTLQLPLVRINFFPSEEETVVDSLCAVAANFAATDANVTFVLDIWNPFRLLAHTSQGLLPYSLL